MQQELSISSIIVALYQLLVEHCGWWCACVVVGWKWKKSSQTFRLLSQGDMDLMS